MSFECLVGEERRQIGWNRVHSAGGNDDCAGFCSQVIESGTRVNDTLAGEESTHSAIMSLIQGDSAVRST